MRENLLPILQLLKRALVDIIAERNGILIFYVFIMERRFYGLSDKIASFDVK